MELRYLLASTLDSSVVLYDALKPSTPEPSGVSEAAQEHRALGKVDRHTPHGHKFSVSVVAWYPVDSGLFITGSYDNTVKVCDLSGWSLSCAGSSPHSLMAPCYEGKKTLSKWQQRSGIFG